MPETYHHCVMIFDGFLSIQNILPKMMNKHAFLRNKTPFEIIRFVSIVCILISAK